MTDIELLYLPRLLCKHLEDLERRIARNKRYWSNVDDDVLYYKKVGCLEDEYENMVSIRNKIRAQIAYAEVRDFFLENTSE